MRLSSNQMVLILVAVLIVGIGLGPLFGAEFSDIPWGAVILAVILGAVLLIARRRALRRMDTMDDGDDAGGA
jgi:F0F1-type ATP synthase assembly protein I